MRLILLSLVTLLASGCFVFEEIDNAMEIIDAHTSLENKKKQEEKAKLDDGEKLPTYAETVGGWFENAKSLLPREHTSSGDPIVRCTVQGRTLFTKRGDCIARGGSPG